MITLSYTDPGKAHANADTLSRLLLSTTSTVMQLTVDNILLFECLQVSPLSVSDIRRWTDCNPISAKVKTFVLQGWPSHLAREEFQPYWRRKHELSVNDHILL